MQQLICDLSETMSKALFPNDVDFFGLKVSPSFISALIVSAFLIVAAIIIRVFVIPRFKKVPGKFQILLESLVGYFDNLAKSNSPAHNSFVGMYVFVAGVYIFFGTIIELFGFRAVLGDLNSCFVLGICSYLVILIGGLVHNKARGFAALKDFSLPFSMSFRLFGAIISGVLVTELIYEGFAVISYTVVVPVFVSVLFTLLHAVIQAYVLTMLTAMFFGENTEPHLKDNKKRKLKK